MVLGDVEEDECGEDWLTVYVDVEAAFGAGAVGLAEYERAFAHVTDVEYFDHGCVPFMVLL